ncbi:hypothetical protein [Streptomyces sp. NPDC101150]|uniref:hypothetical protein n=1 Tax=Streptomyces sp. NPDC101150 TaxID=3366114 RepID=UPI0037F15827
MRDDRDHASGAAAGEELEARSEGLSPGGTVGGGMGAGGIDWGTVTVTMALAPFVQAVASSFGSKLAGTIDAVTRTVVARFLRRQGAQPSLSRRRVEITLTADSGARILFSDGVPAEALAQLVAMDLGALGELGDSPATVTWDRAWCAALSNGGTELRFEWNTLAGAWCYAPPR